MKLYMNDLTNDIIVLELIKDCLYNQLDGKVLIILYCQLWNRTGDSNPYQAMLSGSVPRADP